LGQAQEQYHRKVNEKTYFDLVDEEYVRYMIKLNDEVQNRENAVEKLKAMKRKFNLNLGISCY